MEKIKQFLNAIVHETGEMILVTHDEKGSPFFVDINGNKHHIETLDLSNAFPTYWPMPDQNEQMKSLADIMKTFDVKAQDDHRAEIAEREYWRKLRGDIFIALLNKSKAGYQLQQLLHSVEYSVKELKKQEAE